MNASNYIPAFGFGAKVFPQNVAFSNGIPVVNRVFYVDANSGSDTLKSGRAYKSAVKTLGKAEDLSLTFNYDMIIVAPSANSITTEASITWDKSYISIVGAPAPVQLGQRARIGFGSGATSPCITISGTGNRFVNFKMAVEEDINVMISVTGNRNYFGNCELAGILNSTTGDDTAARVVSMSGAEENLFENCWIGADTIARSTTNATLELASASTRNIFRNCMFPVLADNAGALFFKAASAADVDRYVLFQNCMFHNAVNSTATTMTTGFSLSATLGGTVILDACSILGATDWSTDYTVLRGCNMPDITAGNAGFMEQIAT